MVNPKMEVTHWYFWGRRYHWQAVGPNDHDREET
jgi:hypothetical protein